MREFLRKAGEGFRNFDDAYSAKIDDAIGGYLGRVTETRNPSAIESAGLTGLMAVTRPVTRRYTEEGADVPRAVQYGVPAASAVVKYGIPAGGLTAGGIALAQLTNSLNQQTEGTMQPS